MTLLNLITTIKELDTLTAVLLFAVILISIWQGWITIQGINIKKKAKLANTPLLCIRHRSGSCELTKMQMEYAETVMQQMKALSYSGYLKIRRDKLGSKDNLHKDRDAHHYNSVLYQVWDDIKDLIRYFFRENHLAEMDDSTFELHAQKRVETIMAQLSERLNLLYYPDSDPNRIELYDYNMQFVIPSIRAGVKDILTVGRILAIKFEKGVLDHQIQ